MPKKIPTIWPLEEHTRAKHTILRVYLEAWLPIMGMRARNGFLNGRLVLIDGFAGPGIYSSGDAGSPILMLRAFLNHTLRDRIESELSFVFIDEDAARIEELSRQVDALGPLPKQVTVHVVHGAYHTEFARVLDGLGGQKLAPTFAFIDPFGYSDAPMSLTGRFLQFGRCEVLIYVPLPDINRFIEREGQDDALNSLFGGRDWEDAKPLRGHERLTFLHDLFKKKLEEDCTLEHVRSFQIVTKHRARGYHLFFGTNHVTGLLKMKEAMWRVDPHGGQRFEDSTDPNALVLFQTDVDTRPLRDALIEEYGTTSFAVEDALHFTLLHTPYLPTHVKRRTLKPLEDAGKLDVVKTTRIRRGDYPDGTVLRFKP